MNEDTALVHVDYTTRSAVATDAALRLKNTALEVAALIGKVTNPDEQNDAVKAQTELHKVKRAVEKAEDAAKKPLNEVRNSILTASKAFLKDIEDEGVRLARLVSNFQEFERARVLAEQNKQRAELAELERKKNEEIAAAKTIEKQDEIREQFSRLQTDVAKPIETPRAAGQVVRIEWKVEVKDIWLLARAHPTCVKIEPRMQEIKSMLDAGITVAGITATKESVSTVRTGPERKAISV